jgi:hypothetical protein
MNWNSQYSGTLSSGTKETTAAVNTVVDLSAAYITANPGTPAGYVCTATSLTVENFTTTAIHIQLNGEKTVHEIDPSSSVSFSNIAIQSFLIQETAASYRWTALY